MSDAVHLVAAIAWPLVAGAAILMFRKPLKDALENATQFRFAGQEIQIRRERLDALDLLIHRMEQAEGLKAQNSSTDLQRRIFDRAEADAQVALAELELSISDQVKYLGVANGWVSDIEGGPSELWYQLLQVHQLSESKADTLPALFLYSELQEAALKGHLKASKNDTLRIIRFGLRIHAYLIGIPARVSTVLESGLPVFEDEACLHRRRDIDAILIRTERTGEETLDRV